MNLRRPVFIEHLIGEAIEVEYEENRFVGCGQPIAGDGRDFMLDGDIQ